ncbi:glucosamine-6-phosphate deaminase-like protein [Bacteroides intestinalis CAG:315]|uniref:Glucosamine-6-phosphate deaminase n=1 Tax=Bacteroides intestinalis TaxID=329854 RepID=A0A412Y9I8_9BACE|nr:glucosamine-6-phosphate deaminase [Bacteroides intestinalis]RGV54046.1 glucosamine-6-phosphate deaminase [Bacteroides intestinalis]RHA59706.1 glucosamine-6-phosphate deaminase [Bacteroides intestinalis]CDD93000.1 glucosamine-6-phosphate deaminase-like protein [Bacteroides intestinalis CAG:315]
MKTNLSSQITLNRVSPRYYRPENAFERSVLTRLEKIPADIYESAEEGANHVACEIAQLIRDKQKAGRFCVLALPGGNSPRNVYSALIRMHKEEGLSFRNVIIFNLYEYYPLTADAINSNLNALKEMFLDHVDIDKQNIFSPDGTIPKDTIFEYCRLYEQRIESFGGLDAVLLGIGRVGNIGFNEPGSRLNSTTRLILLDNDSRNEASKMFGSIESTPISSITMGVSTILAAKKIFLMAWGDDKAKMVKECVEGAVTDTIPASYLQTHNNAHVVIDLSAAGNLTRIHRPWLVTSCEWNDKLIRSAIVWLCQLTGKPILKLTNKDYNENGLSELLALFGSAYNVNIKIFNDLQHTITGWPGGKPNADDTYRPERAKPYPKRIVVFSPHPDDDVISMGGTIRRLVEQKHDVHVAYETSGNIAVGDEEVIRFLHFINGFNQIFNNSEDKVITDKYAEIRKFLKEKKDGDIDTRDILTIKGLIRRGEARTACTYNNIPLDHCHFLDLPFYETGRIQKGPLTEADVEIVRNLLREVKPHQIFVAGDLADPHGTHRVCTDAVFAAIDLEKEEGAKWLKDCRIWMYRGAWAEWEIENIEMAVPISPEELRAKRNSILKHQSQMESAPFLGNDERLFWQRSEDRNRGTAALYDSLGLASYEAMEAFVEYIPL